MTAAKRQQMMADALSLLEQELAARGVGEAGRRQVLIDLEAFYRSVRLLPPE